MKRQLCLAGFAVIVLCVPRPASAQLSAGDIVLYAADATRVGAWDLVSDTTAAGGKKLHNPDAGAPKVDIPLANPPDYFELTFNADAGKAYHLWLRGAADGSSSSNDSVHVQFSGSVNSTGGSVFRIGSTTSTEVAFQRCNGLPLVGWIWEDNQWCQNQLDSVYFFQTGAQTIRVQKREDGVSIDQIVLSPDTYLSTRPGRQDQEYDDHTILPKSNSEIVLYAAQAATQMGRWAVETDSSAAGGLKMRIPDAAVKIDPALVNPADYFDLTFNADANKGYRLWVRGKADNNSFDNDSVHVQFSGSVNVSGAPIVRIGTTASDEVVFQGCTGVPLSGWAWEDEKWCGTGSPIYFAVSGQQTLRVQQREDGASIDQIVLSSQRYLNDDPGKTAAEGGNDTTILASNVGGTAPANQPPTVDKYQRSISDPSPAKAPVVFHFTSNGLDPENQCCTYNWTFGDGATSTDRNAVHRYATNGTFNVNLTIKDFAGNAAPQQTDMVGVASAKALPTGAQPLRVAQWNTYKARGTDNGTEGAAIDLLVKWMAGVDADVIAIQEVLGGKGGQTESYRNKLQTRTGQTWYFVHAEQNSGTQTIETSTTNTSGTGVALLSRLPLSAIQSKLLKTGNSQNRQSAVAATVNVNGRSVAVVSVHLRCCADGEDDRFIEAGDLRDWINGAYQEPRIILGDLNATSDKAEIQVLSGINGQYDDAWLKSFNDPAGSTATGYSGNSPSPDTKTKGGRIDYALFTRGSPVLEVLAAQVPDTRDFTTTASQVQATANSIDDKNVRPSDHNPVLVRFAVK